MKRIFFILVLIVYSLNIYSQSVNYFTPTIIEKKQVSNKESLPILKTTSGLNFYVFTRERHSGIDLTSFYTLLRARVNSIFHHRIFYLINARSSKDAGVKVESILLKKNKIISNIWFDSHGHYGNRYSSFRVGSDQFSYLNIHDRTTIKYLQSISKYCDSNTRIGIGSCYGGADFYFPETDSTPATRMNGDSLMMGMGDIFPSSVIFASESWVMAKPGMFTNRFGFAGYPLDRRFKDSIFAPVWERLGIWKLYSKQNGKIFHIPTVSLDRKGNIHIRDFDYNDFKRTKKRIRHALKALKPARAKLS